MEHSQPGDRGVVVLVEAAQERIELGQCRFKDLLHPSVEVAGSTFGQYRGELTYQEGQLGAWPASSSTTRLHLAGQAGGSPLVALEQAGNLLAKSSAALRRRADEPPHPGTTARRPSTGRSPTVR